MRFRRYSPSFAAGAAGLLTGYLYHKVSSHRQFLTSAADIVKLEIDGIISKEVEEHVNKLTPIMKYGFPSYDTLRLKDNFVLSYDRRNRIPNWVMEHLTSDTLEGESCVSRRRSKFFPDNTIHKYFRATLDDYKDSGYDKGHLAAAANHKNCPRAYNETFVLSNVAPQNDYFNRRIWHKLESHVRNMVKKYGSVYVCSGPLYLPREITLEEEELFFSAPDKGNKRKKQTQNTSQRKTKKYVIYEVIGENDVAVPTHFFKIILCEAKNDKYVMEAYIIPNGLEYPEEPLSKYEVSRDTIERAAGFLLFHQLPPDSYKCLEEEESETEQPMKES